MPSHFKRPFAVLLAAVIASFAACAAPAPPAASRFTAEQVRADFATLYQRLQDSHYDLFVRRPRGEYDALFQRTQAELDAPMDLDEVRRHFQRFVAYGNVAHARIDAPPGDWEQFRAAGGKAFPLLLRVVEGKAYVVDGHSPGTAIAQGDEVLSVDGEPALRWLDRLRTQVSADNDYLFHTQLETQLPMLVWREHGERDAFEVVLDQAGTGRRLALTVPALSRADSVAAAARRPGRFELDWDTRQARMLDGGIAYLRPGPFYDNRPEAADPWDASAFKAFIDQAFASFIAQGAKTLLIDLRDNPGGDNSFSDHMLAWIADRQFRFSPQFEIKVSQAAIESNRQRLQASGGKPDSTSAQLAAAYAGQSPGSRINFPVPLVAPRAGQRFPGDVHMLVNRRSYSNTVLVAAIAQDYGFATVLGEETADLASTYGAMEKFTLPLTGIEVGFPKARILRPSGDPQPRGVIPDIAIATPLTATTGDVVLARAVEIVLQKERARGKGR
ncbi:MAG: S41 family peptidase [Lysobacter sp.]